MTREDALLYFPLNDVTDIDDLYDDLLFEQKQFLSNRMPISKVFKSRIARLEKMNEAYLFLGGSHKGSVKNEIKLLPLNSKSIEVTYKTFQQNSTLLKLGIFNAKSICELLNIIDLLFENQLAFAKKFTTIESGFNIQPIISKEPDAMEIIQAIKDANTEGISNFIDLSQLQSDNILIQEANRLSLWLKLETNV